MYSIADYGEMIADTARMNAFATALRATVKPGSVVVDLGTGTGIFALLACRLGARRVYAIEPDAAIQVAKEIAAANNCADQIEFVQAMSTDVNLPERADVIVSDIGGMLPWFQKHIPVIADARRRFLAPGGVVIPQQDVAWAAVIDAPELYERQSGPWRDNQFGLDMEAARRIVTNTWSRGSVTREHLLAEPQAWATLDYARIEDPDVCARIDWSIGRSGTGHGLAAGFDRTVIGGVHLSNAPAAAGGERSPGIYGTVFFPWPEPVALATGDLVTVELAARLVADDYIWSWKTSVLDRGDPSAEKAVFSQSTFFGAPISPAQLRKRAATYTPSLNEEGRITRFVLEAMGHGVALGEIAQQVSARFSSRFPTPQDGLSFVADLSVKFG
jgi:protein arginine N-methyltransferase 1